MADLPPWFTLFCASDADRLQVLVRVLHASGLAFELVKTAGHRHVQVRGKRSAVPEPGEKVLVAHYDRVSGAPGANDNGASVLALVDYLRRPRTQPPLRVVFTDGEELAAHSHPRDQGAFALAQHWGSSSGAIPFVFDMVGIGDTLVLGHLGEQLFRQSNGGGLSGQPDAYSRLRMTAKRFLATCGAGDTVEVNTPFSDDLGFLLAGLPAVQISLLPRKEALAYRRLRSQPGELDGGAAGGLPPSWKSMHTAADRPEALWARSRLLIAEVLDKLEAYPWPSQAEAVLETGR